MFTADITSVSFTLEMDGEIQFCTLGVKYILANVADLHTILNKILLIDHILNINLSMYLCIYIKFA